MKNIEISKKLMAFLSATTIMLTMNGCKEKEVKPTETQQTTTTSSTTTSGTTSTTTTDLNPTSSILTDVSITTQIPTETTTVIEPTSSKEESTTTTTTKKSTTSSKTTTSKSTTTKKKTTSTKRTTTTSKKKTTKTTTKTTNSTKSTGVINSIYDTAVMTKDNINDITFFQAMSRNMANAQSTSLMTSYGYYYNDEILYTNGYHEFALVLAITNYEYIETETLISVFGDSSLEDMRRYAHFIRNITAREKHEQFVIEFERYIIDKDIANLFSQFHDALIFNHDKFAPLMEKYFITKTSDLHYGNTSAGVDHMMHGLYSFNKEYVEDNNLRRQLSSMKETVIADFDEFIVELYNRVHSKEKTYTKTN